MRTLFALNYTSLSLPPPDITSKTDAASTKWERNPVFKGNLTARSLRAGFRQDPSNEESHIAQFRPGNVDAVCSSDSHASWCSWVSNTSSCTPASLCWNVGGKVLTSLLSLDASLWAHLSAKNLDVIFTDLLPGALYGADRNSLTRSVLRFLARITLPLYLGQ